MRSWDGTPRPSAWASFSDPGLDGAPPLRLGAPEAGKERGRGRGSLRRVCGGRRQARLGAGGPRKGSCAPATGGCDTAEDGCITITRHPQPGNIHHFKVLTGPYFLFLPNLG